LLQTISCAEASCLPEAWFGSKGSLNRSDQMAGVEAGAQTLFGKSGYPADVCHRDTVLFSLVIELEAHAGREWSGGFGDVKS